MSTDHDQTGSAQAGFDVRLAVIRVIVRVMRDDRPFDRIIQAAVDGLHVHFPHLRSAYSTVAQDRRVTVDHAAGPAGLARPARVGELVLPGRVMETLRARDLIAIEDTTTGSTGGVLSAGLVSGNVRAQLGAPVHHSGTLVGLLSLDSSTPRQWSELERGTLRDATDLLGIALRDADARHRTTGLGITERELREPGISQSEARLQTLMEPLVDGVALLVNGAIVFANPAMGRILGYTPDELAGRRPTEFLLPGDRQRAMERIDALTDGEPAHAAEYQMVRRDGTTVPVLISSRRIEYNGRPALLSVHRDLTEQRELEEQLRQTQRLDSVGLLAGGVAHNFNNALTAIIGYSELIAMRLDEQDPILADVNHILAVAERAASLTRQLLTFSRKERINPTVFDLNEAIESSSDLLGPLMGDDVQLHVRLDRSFQRVRADRRQMEQVITNLVLNARDAMRGGGSLTIETRGVVLTEALARIHPDARRGSYTRLSVIDTGTGMERATVARIFEPFFTTKEPGQGVGLGLSMVHGAVKQTGGFVTVDSKPGRGTTFRLYLPACEEPTGGSEVVVQSSAQS